MCAIRRVFVRLCGTLYSWRGICNPGIFQQIPENFANLAILLVVIDLADCGALNTSNLKIARYLLKQAFVDSLFCLQRLNALYYGPAQLRISPLGLQVQALWDWSAEYFIP